MKNIYGIEANTPDATERKFPFEVVIHTIDPERIASGGPVRKVLPCDGYLLCTLTPDGTTRSAQGEVNLVAVLDFLIGQWGGIEVISTAIALGMRHSDGKDENE